MKTIKYFWILIILFIPIFVKAETLQELQNELAKLQTQYNTNKNNKQMTQAQIEKVNKEIAAITKSIENTRNEIKQAEEDIEESKKNIDAKKIETDGLIQFLQISNGGNIYLEYLFDAENYTDFIYRYEVVKQLTNYNSDLIDELEQMILDLQKKEEDLKQKFIKLENERDELSEKSKSLSYTLESYKTEGVDIEKDIEDMKEQIKLLEDLGCGKNEEFTTCAMRVANENNNVTINASGFSYPLVQGCVTSEYTGFNIRTDYSGGGSHHGIDLDCVGEGTKVYATAIGVVTRITKFNCGGNAVYIHHVVNGRHYTSVYMHLLSVASGLSVGSVVTNQTVIGYVGGYSTAIQNGGYDTCTTGAHLHFGLAEGDSAYDFNSHSFNPREKFWFPILVYNGGGYFYR